MNERTERITAEQYFSSETAALLPSESRRRSLLFAELQEKNRMRENLQKKLDDFMETPLCDELFSGDIDLNDEQTRHWLNVMDEIDRLKADAAHLRRTITRLDCGETIADIYRNIFG